MGNKIVRYESGQQAYPFGEAPDSGDRKTFQSSFAPISAASGAEAVVAPYGLLTGGVITATAVNDQVSVAAMTLMAPGMTGADADGVKSVSSGTVSISRGATTDTHRITSITVASNGSLAAIPGVDDTAFSEVRGANGGPPYIPEGSIEIGQVRTTSVDAAVVVASEIFQIPGTTQELSAFPVYDLNSATGEITFAEALPAIHTGDAPKKVYIKGSTPIYATISNARDWVPAESTYSINSTDTYDGPVGSASASLSQASFTAILKDGITDPFLSKEGENLWFEFRPDRDKLLPKQLTQGILGISRTFPAGGGSIEAACTVTPENKSVDIAA